MSAAGRTTAVSFCLAAIAALFLAAEKGSPAKDKRNYFLVFLLLLFSYMINGWLGYLCRRGQQEKIPGLAGEIQFHKVPPACKKAQTAFEIQIFQILYHNFRRVVLQ